MGYRWEEDERSESWRAGNWGSEERNSTGEWGRGSRRLVIVSGTGTPRRPFGSRSRTRPRPRLVPQQTNHHEVLQVPAAPCSITGLDIAPLLALTYDLYLERRAKFFHSKFWCLSFWQISSLQFYVISAAKIPEICRVSRKEFPSILWKTARWKKAEQITSGGGEAYYIWDDESRRWRCRIFTDKCFVKEDTNARIFPPRLAIWLNIWMVSAAQQENALIFEIWKLNAKLMTFYTTYPPTCT